MTQEDEGFLRQLLATFQIEAEEHLGAMSSLTLELERAAPGTDTAPTIETLFREAHSLKGAARSVNITDVERVCQALERVMSVMKRRELATSPAFFEALYAALDGLTQMLAQRVDGQGAVDPLLPVTLARSLDALLAAPAAAGAPTAVRPAVVPAAVGLTEPAIAALAGSGDTVRVATAKLEALMTLAEELQAFKFSGEHLVAELHALGQALDGWKRQSDKRARGARALRRAHGSVDRNGQQQRALGHLLDASEHDELLAKALAGRVGQLQRAADQAQRGFGQRVDRLQADMRAALMLPFATLLAPMPKLVRDLAQASGKDVELLMSGTTLEIDRRVLEQIKTPLTHLVRNAIDHGIEPPLQRLQVGKPQRGRLSIEITPREGNRVELLIADDGAGVPLDKVRARAERMGLAGGVATAWTPSQLADLVFESGLSTSPIVTDLSGHGLGLAIVREKIDRLGGTVAVEVMPDGAGTRFRIVLPSTLATFRGLLVSVAGETFVLPSRNVERVARVPLAAIVTAADGRDSVALDGATLPLVPLAELLELPPRPMALPPGERRVQLVVAGIGDKGTAFAVDEVIGDQEVLVKPLAAPLRRVRNVAGATVLGAGRVVPLLNVADLMKSAAVHRVHGPRAARHGRSDTPRASLLVAEDSVTTRRLLKDILESEGYRVTTAADGIDALASLQSGEFDLLVSDVEMPRLDGFGLTARVRTDKRLADLPVVLVTALDSREDKERGVEVGANAYIVKSGFDQRRLLQAIRTLI